MARAPKSGPTGREAIEEIDRRLGGLLGPLTEGLARLADAAEKAQDAAGAREFTIDTGNGPVRLRAGYAVRVGGLGGKAAATGGRDPAAPVREPGPQAGPSAAVFTEPAVDVFEDAQGWSLTTDLPGATLDALTLTLEAGVLMLETTGTRRYRAAVDVPPWLTLPAIERRLANGVLELTAPRPDGAP